MSAISSEKYFLKSERLGLRLWTKYYLELAMDLWGDPEVTKLIGGPFSKEQVEARLAKEIETFDRSQLQYWPLFLRSTGEFVGCCGLRPYKPEENIVELGFHLCQQFWGQGFAIEAAACVIDYAFNSLKVSGLFAGHHPQNFVSKKIICKLGFEPNGEVLFPPTGLMHPSYLLLPKN